MTRRPDQPAERPRRRKKSQPNKSIRGYIILGGVVGAVAVLASVAAAVALLRQNAGSSKVTTPERYVSYSSPEDVFHVSLPEGWKIESGGRKTLYWASAEKGRATIKVHES